MSTPVLTALVRCRDEGRGIGRLLDALRDQKLPGDIQVVVVDSGSRDRTLDEVRARDIEPVLMAPDEFTYGRALNRAAERADAELCLSVSAHVTPPDPYWADRLVAAMTDRRLACAYGESYTPELRPMTEPLLQDVAHAERHPFYGYSNSAGIFRRSLWERHRFDEQLIASEDKEWAWHWLREGMLVRLDPALAALHSHDDEGALRTYRRYRDCWRAEASFRAIEPTSLSKMADEWWNGPHTNRSRLRARLDPRRIAAYAGQYVGTRPSRTRPTT